MSKGTAIIGMLVALVVGVFIGQTWNKGSEGSAPSAAVPAAALPDQNVERYKIPVGNSPVKGPENAKVTIIEWSDFQCPFCSRVEPTIDQIMKAYGRDVRVVWKNQPLPFHQNAMPSAQVATAAFVKKGNGAFWKVHDTLFHNQQALDRPSLEKYGKEAGLSDDDLKEALDQKKYDQQIQADSAEGSKFGARGTPSFFINGRPLSGAQPYEAFKKIIDEEIANANRAMQGGVKLAAVYDTLTANGKPAAAPPSPQPQQPQPAQADPNAVYKVPVGNSPQKGPATAKVTVVIFSDFQCPFCSRVEPTLKTLGEQYGKDIRFVWKNNPLPFHQNAMPAARAAMAANEQGADKFWEFHDKLFADQQHLDAQTFEKYAGDLGLNMNKFKAALTDKKIETSIQEDMALANRFGAQGTPGFFINGRPLRGAQPLESFKAVIDKEIQAADALLKKGVKAKDLYAELTKDGKDKAEGGAPQRPNPGAPDSNTVYKALIEDAPVKGADAKHAKVTIVEWSDYQCPFCGRVEPTIDQIMKEYGSTVRVAFKELPLPMHNNAHLAAEAALAAKAQGKFWEMHDVMFKNQQALDRASLEKYAQQIGLNVDKFKADLDSGKWKQKVDAEMQEGNKIGARGTPSFFINGKSFVGAQPFEAFKAKIEEASKDADAHVKGGNYGKYYDDLMKTAKAEVAAAPAGGGEAPDNKVYKVDAGNAPSVGPKNAPVQIVEWSDFQCPFCSRVEPTIKQIEEKYAGKVHIVWKNYPLPFHQFAQGAAEAAMAANAQGKFWQMHDKMFANQQALDRPSLEKYAQEIGLDMGQFKGDLDSGKYKASISADMAQANALDSQGFGTPTFFINGHKISGAMPFESFAAIIDGELKKKH